MRPIERPKPHPDNPRTHSDEQIALLVKSIETLQTLRPILVDEQDYILAGEGLWRAKGSGGRTKKLDVRRSPLPRACLA